MSPDFDIEGCRRIVDTFEDDGSGNYHPIITTCCKMLDEIERLQEATRWRDPHDTDDLSDYEPVLVVNFTGGAAIGYTTPDGWSAFGFDEFEVAAWMPVPDPPAAEPAAAPPAASITVDATYGMLGPVTFAAGPRPPARPAALRGYESARRRG